MSSSAGCVERCVERSGESGESGEGGEGCSLIEASPAPLEAHVALPLSGVYPIKWYS